MRPSVNYLIAACSHRVARPGLLVPGKEILRTHLAIGEIPFRKAVVPCLP